jgi:hypothetical protein
MDFHDILDILLPIFALGVVVLITVRSILASGTRAGISLAIYFILIGAYKWYTKMNKNLDLYTYILDSLNEKKLWWWSFLLLIFIIQYFMLFDYAIKNINRQFNLGNFFMCISLCLMCNLLLSISTLSINLPIRDIISLKNPGYSTLVMCAIFLATYFSIFILRQFFPL